MFGLFSVYAVSLVLWSWFDTDQDSGSECFSLEVEHWSKLFLKGGLHRVLYIYISSLSDHFTHFQLGEDDSMREETFCLSDTVVVLDELQEQGLRAGAVKICWHLSCSSPWKCQGSSSLVEPFKHHNCQVTAHFNCVQCTVQWKSPWKSLFRKFGECVYLLTCHFLVKQFIYCWPCMAPRLLWKSQWEPQLSCSVFLSWLSTGIEVFFLVHCPKYCCKLDWSATGQVFEAAIRIGVWNEFNHLK